MVYLIIAVVLVVIIAPILSILPSKRQKERMAMRMEARRSGVDVELTSIEDPNPKQDKYISNLGKSLEPILKVTAWRKPRQRETYRNQDWRNLPRINWSISRTLDAGWRWDEAPEIMNAEFKSWMTEAVEKLPQDVERVEESTYLISVYWHEGAQESTQQIVDFLNECAAIPLHNFDQEED